MTGFITFFVHNLLPFLIVLTVLVFVHELGHYLAAIRCRVKVEVFSIGFGPELFGFTDKKGTRWKFSLIPLGGYVKMFGDADASSRPDEQKLSKMEKDDYNLTLNSKTVGQRALVSGAGPFANFLFAFVVLAALIGIKGEQVMPPVVGKVVPGKIAEKVGILPGDRISEINGTPIKDFFHLSEVIQKNVGKEQVVKLWRPSEIILKGKDVNLKEQFMTIAISANLSSKEKQWGVQSGEPTYESRNPVESVFISAKSIWFISVSTLKGIGQMIMGERSTKELGGLLTIGDMASRSVHHGLVTMFYFMALLSINLGLINLLPIPMLDGGHLLFQGIEAIIRRPVPPKVQEYSFFVGLVFVLGMMSLSMWNDLLRYDIFNKIISFIPFLATK